MIELYFSQHYDVDPEVLAAHGAFDISLVSDLPLFVDPFLLFNSEDPAYQTLHQEILRYLFFLRDQASAGLDEELIRSWYCFKEVKQNWFGFTLFGNDGHGLGIKFARALHEGLGDILAGFGHETVTRGTHLEKLCLISPGVGRDNISDFTTRLIKDYLCEYTQAFALEHIDEALCDTFSVVGAGFNYDTRSWMTKPYVLPRLGNDYVLLTPMDMLTRDDTWINYPGMINSFTRLPPAVSDAEQRAKIEQYFARVLGQDPSAQQMRDAAAATIRRFPELIDLYIKGQEDQGHRATALSAEKVEEVRRVLGAQIRQAIEQLLSQTEFYDRPWTSYQECLVRVEFFKDFIENKDGYRLLNRHGEPFSREEDVQLAFGLVWGGTELDVNREVNNGRGPVDFKASYGAGDKSLIEFKLASNTALKKNLQKQVAIYEKANGTRLSVKVIVCYTERHQDRVNAILNELGLHGEESIVLIDARNDNKPSASVA